MKEINRPAVEPIRKYPVWFARALNRVIGWTNTYCSGGCGYPVTGQYEVSLDNIDGVPVVMLVCSLDSECSRNAEDQPFDANGQSYADIRPHIREMSRDTDRYRLSFSR